VLDYRIDPFQGDEWVNYTRDWSNGTYWVVARLATGELIAAVPVADGGERVGLDISVANVAAARARFPEVEFRCGDFRGAGLAGFDAVIMSDVLEHVPDDVAFLRDAAALGELVLVNLPLEDNWLNDRRAYGPDDVSGRVAFMRYIAAMRPWKIPWR